MTDGRAAPGKLYLFRGQRLTMKQVAEILGVHPATVGKHRCGELILEGADLIDPFPDPHPRARMLAWNGLTMSIRDWSRRTGLSEKCIAGRISRGWPLRYALTLPANVRGFDTLTYQGRTMTVGQWASEVGLSPQALRFRLKSGWPVAEALTAPQRPDRRRTIKRNATLIARIVRAFRAQGTGGISPTFPNPRGTGGRSTETDLERQELTT